MTVYIVVSQMYCRECDENHYNIIGTFSTEEAAHVVEAKAEEDEERYIVISETDKLEKDKEKVYWNPHHNYEGIND